MKNIITAMAVAFSLFFGLSVSVYAAGEPDVYVDKEGKLQTQNLNFDAFENMASGESATEVISVANKSDETVNFYVSQNTIQSLEQSNNTNGAAYEFGLSVGSSKDDARLLLSKETGGYDVNGKASDEGLTDIKEIEGYTFFKTLKPGESTNLYMTLYLNGEGNDINYANAVGKIQLGFKIDTYSHQPSIIEQIKTNTVYKYVKTGDENHVLIYLAGLVAGAIIVSAWAVKKHRKKVAG